MICFAVLTISDSASTGNRIDVSGDQIASTCSNAGWDLVQKIVIPDERQVIAHHLMDFSADDSVDVVFTTGGTGLGPRDVTPEATRDAIEREIPGMAEAMRLEGMKKTPFAMTSRQVVGVRGNTLIVNLPGSPKAVIEGLQVVMPVIPHVVQLLHGHTSHDASGNSNA